MKSRLFVIFLNFLPLFSIFFVVAFFCQFVRLFWHFFCTKKVSCVMYHKSHVTCHISHVTCYMSHVTCHLPSVTCHLPPVTNANSHRPSPADSPIIHSRLVPHAKKPLIIMDKKCHKNCRNFLIDHAILISF